MANQNSKSEPVNIAYRKKYSNGFDSPSKVKISKDDHRCYFKIPSIKQVVIAFVGTALLTGAGVYAVTKDRSRDTRNMDNGTGTTVCVAGSTWHTYDNDPCTPCRTCHNSPNSVESACTIYFNTGCRFIMPVD